MCAIVGGLIHNINTNAKIREVNDILNYIMITSHARGRDGRGYYVNSDVKENISLVVEADRNSGGNYRPRDYLVEQCNNATFIGNLRAEPTTEFIRHKKVTDQQPYQHNGWSIVHNGTIANDKELRTHAVKTKIDSAAIVERLGKNYEGYYSYDNNFAYFYSNIKELRGSYAILATCDNVPNQIMVAVNYRPLWMIKTEFGLFFASSRDYFPDGYNPQMLEPYTVNSFTYENDNLLHLTTTLYSTMPNKRALVVCSGGLDSVVAATIAKKNYSEIELVHFQYGCRAEGNEVEAVRKIAHELDVPLKLFPLPIYDKNDSPLFDDSAPIAYNHAGAEFAFEWVPARNLVLLSVAAAYAEANGHDTIILGNNLEEAGAYPDNEPEFINKFNDLLPFAVGDGKRLRIEMPVGNLMKHEIVAIGLHVGAPLHLTWSCYYNRDKHCGKCGPCFMRKTAFDIANKKEVIDYEE